MLEETKFGPYTWDEENERFYLPGEDGEYLDEDGVMQVLWYDLEDILDDLTDAFPNMETPVKIPSCCTGYTKKEPLIDEQSTFAGYRMVTVNCHGDSRMYPLKGLIIHLNDEHKWTREQIADWLETLDVDLELGKIE